MFGLVIKVNADGTAAKTDIHLTSLTNIWHLHIWTSVYGYIMRAVSTLWLNLKVRWNHTYINTHTACNFVVLWLRNEYGAGNTGGSVTLGQGDRSGQVWVCVSILCQDSRWLVKEYQWPSPYPSPPTYCLWLVPKSLVQTPASELPHSHWKKEHKYRCGWFIHELGWESVFSSDIL